MWNIEDIHDYNCVFVRVHKSFISSKDNLPHATAFTNTPKEGPNLSCDWCKYCSPFTSRELVGKQQKADGTYKNPEFFFLWSFNVIDLRNNVLPEQKVIHEPIFNNPEYVKFPNNRAHSIIEGKKLNTAEFRVNLLKIGKWVIGPID